jgi:hypothetical protein
MMDRPRGTDRLAIPGRWLGAGLALAYVAVVAIYLASGLRVEAWDDAYFFKRIGLNLLEHGSLAWNVEDGPVYGNTSQGFQLVALLPLLIDASHYVVIIKLVSALSMVLLLALYMRAALKLAGSPPGSPSDVALAWGLGFLGASAPFLLLLMHSGMETSVALAMLGGNLLAIRHGASTGAGTRQGTVAVVATTALVYLTRPDAVLISLVSITAYYWMRDRRPPWRILFYCGVTLLALLGVLWLYFGTPLPLAFYLKSQALTVYTDRFVELSLGLKRRNLAGLFVMAAPLVYVIAHGRSAWAWALALSFAAFNGYHYLSTVEVMGYFARFYMVSMVPLTLAAIDAAPRFRERSRVVVSLVFCALYVAAVLYLYRQRILFDEKDQLITRVTDEVYLGYAIAAASLLIGARIHAGAAAALAAAAMLAGGLRGLPLPALELPADEVLQARHIERVTTFRGIDAVRACIPEPLQLYHSEIGIPGILFQRSTITDMAGLMDEDIALQGMDFDARCMADRPEVLYLPHRVYETLRERIAGSECIKDYRLVVRDSSSPLYIRKDLAPDFLACARKLGNRWVGAR